MVPTAPPTSCQVLQQSVSNFGKVRADVVEQQVIGVELNPVDSLKRTKPFIATAKVVHGFSEDTELPTLVHSRGSIDFLPKEFLGLRRDTS